MKLSWEIDFWQFLFYLLFWLLILDLFDMNVFYRRLSGKLSMALCNWVAPLGCFGAHHVSNPFLCLVSIFYGKDRPLWCWSICLFWKKLKFFLVSIFFFNLCDYVQINVANMCDWECHFVQKLYVLKTSSGISNECSLTLCAVTA